MPTDLPEQPPGAPQGNRLDIVIGCGLYVISAALVIALLAAAVKFFRWVFI
jgi:hypothetical protein